MASDSSLQNQCKQLTPASNVPFQIEDCIIKFNNGVALMESTNDAYKPLLQFLENSCISVSLTKQPSTFYLKYLREFWYTAEADTMTKSITFTLLHFDKPLTFDLNTFSSVIGLDRSDEFVHVPPKKTVKAGLANLGLVDKDHPSLSSSDIINSSPGSHDQLNGNQQTIAYSLCWGLNIDIADILFSDLGAHLHPEGSKNQRKPNPSFCKPTWKNETTLTSHMCKVTELSPKPIQSLISPSDEMNADGTIDKSLSETFVLPVTQPKAQTAKRPKKKKIPSSTQPEVLQSNRSSKSPSSQATHP
ncbi:hypothetical protein Tco_1002202 [Tanacetum coccineum]|uniref:Uncharacterized protein n=1 Tax=Tanacetum coccineum TaxID=301880 RepID=A0ABQ5F6Q8_9ASTR